MLKLDNLTPEVRAHMLAEVNADIAAGTIYMCPRFNDDGNHLYHDLLRQAIQFHDDEWLANQLKENNCFNEYETRNRGGKTHTARVPHTAPETLAEGEFNCFYLRGLSIYAGEKSISELEIYRARHSENPRSESVRKIGTMINATALLTDLRAHTGIEKAMGLPPGPNSGLSARLRVQTIVSGS